MKRFIDETNKVYGDLTVIERVGNNADGTSMWRCVCKHGEEKIVRGVDLRNGKSSRCKCETGNRYGRLVVIRKIGSNHRHKVTWLCQCDCGNETIVPGVNLRNGNTRSCGCLHKEILDELNRKRSGTNSPMYGKKGYERNGDRNPRWNGGRNERKDGYINIYRPNHPRAKTTKYVMEHVLVMEKMLGRPLKEKEVVHHCDGNPSNNGPFNLRLFPNNAEHTAFHAMQNKERRLV